MRSVVKMPGRSTERMPIEGKTVTSLVCRRSMLSKGELGSPEAKLRARRADQIDRARRVLRADVRLLDDLAGDLARRVAAGRRSPVPETLTLTGLSPCLRLTALLRQSSAATAIALVIHVPFGLPTTPLGGRGRRRSPAP